MTSLVALTAIYAVLLVVEVKLLVKYIRGGVASAMPELGHAQDSDDQRDKNDDGTGPDKSGDDVLAFATKAKGY